jgi:hypothetical protein
LGISLWLFAQIKRHNLFFRQSAIGVKLRPIKFIKPFIKQDFTLYTTANKPVPILREAKKLLGFLNRFNNLEGFGKS